MTEIYNRVTVAGLPNYLGTWLQLPSNLHFSNWETCAEEDTNLINFLKYGFPIEYEVSVPTPADHNHVSAMHHPRDVVTYV